MDEFVLQFIVLCHAGCESYQELKDSLWLIFKAVAEEEIRPQIHARNTTQVCWWTYNFIKNMSSFYFEIETIYLKLLVGKY